MQFAGQVVAHLVGRLEVLLHPQPGVDHGRGHAAGRRLRELDVPLPEGWTVRRTRDDERADDLASASTMGIMSSREKP